MEKPNEQLRAEVATLGKRHQIIAKKILGKNSMWVVVAQYFRLFRHGLALGSNLAVGFNQQLDFIQASMTHDVVTSAGFGPESMMRSWRFLQWFDDVEVELEGLRDGGDEILTAVTKTTVTITTQTLRHLFPHLCGSENGSRSAIVADKLVGQRVVMHGSTGFTWDEASGRVSSVQAQSDMLTPMLHMLGSLDGVTHMFKSALMHLNFQVRLAFVYPME
ncbi:hypothetical protein PI124_g18880 [Phytophthora idaei]|nr:hypothetical protein PI125_g19816 [Phytophthora idaei]KAG3148672.1 hypothetical protein PI126_g12361 [Phytophthora idaei]KAG3236102.1 hypothetical protein PI124_g18880 [Phytophthora idaei]